MTDNIRCARVPSKSVEFQLIGFRAYSAFQAQLETGNPHLGLSIRTISDQVGSFIFSRSDLEAYASYFFFPEEGQSAVHVGYAQGASQEELEITKMVDRQSSEDYSYSGRLGYALISTESSRRAYLRVIDGSGSGLERPRGDVVPDYYLPAERLLHKKGIKTAFFDDYRKKGYKIFELGKYFIDENLDPQAYKKARKELWKWVYRNYLDERVASSEKILFVFDVFNEKRKDSTMKNFGAEVIPPEHFLPRLEPPNYILISDLAQMREYVSRLINAH